MLELKAYCGPDQFYGRSKFGQYNKEKNRDPYHSFVVLDTNTFF